MKHRLMAVAAFFCIAPFAIPILSQEEPTNQDLIKDLRSIEVGGALAVKHAGGTAQPAAAFQPPPPPGFSVPMWANTFTDNKGNVFPYKMVGTDPSLAGAGTTNVPIVIIPLRLNFAAGNASISPSNIGCVDNASALARVINSPLFNTNITWLEGNTVVGVTQFTDAFQRANFWDSVGTISPGYHVLLGPAQVTPEAFLNVPSSLGGVITTACAGHAIGGVAINYVDAFIQNLIVSLNIPPTTFTLVVTYDVVELLGGGGLFLGYHSGFSNANGLWTYAIGSYVDPGILNLKVNDVSVLSHELGEWLDDPTGDNPVPAWKAGQATACQTNLEVGDPLSGTNSTVFMNDGSTYTVQDLAFLSWFARRAPSTSVNGWYSTLNSFASFSDPTKCPPPN